MKERRYRDPQVLAERTTLEEAALYEERALYALRDAGYRITMPRVQVIRALADTEIALSAYAIHEKVLSASEKIDVVSVYRILATLQEVGLVHHVGLANGYFPAKKVDAKSKRSEIVLCSECDSVFELIMPDEVDQLVGAQAEQAGFKVSAVKVEVLASSCPKCKNKKAS